MYFLHKSDDNKVTQYCRNQQISQMWLDFASEKTTQLLAVKYNQPQVMSQKSKYPSERKKLTQQLNHYRWLESQVFVTRLPLQLCQKWSDFGSVKTKMTHCTLLSMQSLLKDIFGPILIDRFSLEEIWVRWPDLYYIRQPALQKEEQILFYYSRNSLCLF